MTIGTVLGKLKSKTQFAGIITPVVSASGTDMVIRYIHYQNLQFLNHVIIIKTKVLLPQE